MPCSKSDSPLVESFLRNTSRFESMPVQIPAFLIVSDSFKSISHCQYSFRDCLLCSCTPAPCLSTNLVSEKYLSSYLTPSCTPMASAAFQCLGCFSVYQSKGCSCLQKEQVGRRMLIILPRATLQLFIVAQLDVPGWRIGLPRHHA